jgi:NADH-quinone oxidoreductase subunit G
MQTEIIRQPQLINFTIDGKAISVPKGTTVYEASKQLGIELPIFCYLDRLPPFGACRVCLVEVEKMAKPQTSCTLEATEGMVVKTQSALAVEGRKSIIEYLLINHPLDCPICDRGGECPLQENTLRYGPGMSRFFEEKRHFKKALPLGPVLMLDRERCIVCARCTRFGEHLAGDHALQMLDRGYRTEVGTPNSGPADSKFIGNTIMICPVGALTSQVYRFRARPWDNDPTDSTCTLCPVGCSMILDARDGEIMRTRSRENPAINDIWLCDKGWFGYEFTYHPDRLQKPLIRREGVLQPATWDEALSLIVQKIQAAKPSGQLAALGGNPLTTEENFLFQKLMRQGAGVNHVDHRVGMPLLTLQEEGLPAGMEASIETCETLSFAVLFGLDLTEDFPVIWLRLRQAVNKNAKVLFFGHYAPEIAPYLTHVILHPPGDELKILGQYQEELKNLANEGQAGAFFVGSQYLHQPQRATILAELLKLKQQSPSVSLHVMEGRGNSMGARLAGMRPDLGPWGQTIQPPGLNATQIVQEGAKNGWQFLYVAGANPAKKYPSELWAEMRRKLGFLVVQDLFLTETAQQADVVLPTLTYIEKGGSFITISGCVQTLIPGKEIPENIYSDGEIFSQIAQKLKISLDVEMQFANQLKTKQIELKRPDHIEASTSSSASSTGLVATFAQVLFDEGVRMTHDSHVKWLAKEPRVRLHPEEAKQHGIQDDDFIQIKTAEQSIRAQVKLDHQVARRTLVIPLGFDQKIPVHELGISLFNGLSIEIKKDEMK